MREAAAAALVVALVGGHQAVVAEPADGVGLAQHSLLGAGAGDDLVVVGVDLLEIDRTGAEVAGDRARGEVDQDDVVVLLQRHGGHVGGVDVDELGLGILGRHARRGR